MAVNRDQILQLLIDSVQEFVVCSAIYGSAEFSIEAYEQDAVFRKFYDDALTNCNMTAVQVAFIIRAYRDDFIFPCQKIRICSIEGNFDVFYEMYLSSLERLQTLDHQIRHCQSESGAGDDLLARYGRAIRNFSACCYFLVRYVSDVIDCVHVKIDSEVSNG